MHESDSLVETKAAPAATALASIASEIWSDDMRLLTAQPVDSSKSAEHLAFNDEDDERDPRVRDLTPYQKRQYDQMPPNEQHDYRQLDEREQDEYLRKNDADKYYYLRKTPDERWDEDHGR